MDDVLQILNRAWNPEFEKNVRVEATEQITTALLENPCGSIGVLLELCIAPTTPNGTPVPDHLAFVAASQIRNYFVHIAEPDNIKTLIKSADFAALQALMIDGLLKMHNRPVIKRQVLSAVWHLVQDAKWDVYSGGLQTLIKACTATAESSATCPLTYAETLVEILVGVTRTFHVTHVLGSKVIVPMAVDILSTLPPLLQLCTAQGRTPQVADRSDSLSTAHLHLVHQAFKVFEDCIEYLLKENTSGLLANTISPEELASRTEAWFEYLVEFPSTTLDLFTKTGDYSFLSSNEYNAFTKGVKRVATIAFNMLTHIHQTTQSEPTKKKKSVKASSISNKKAGSFLAHQMYLPRYAERFHALSLKWIGFCTNKEVMGSKLGDSPLGEGARKTHEKSMQWFVRNIKMANMVEPMYKSCIAPNFMDLIGLLFNTLCYTEDDAALYEVDPSTDLQEFSMLVTEETMPEGEFSLRQSATKCIVAFTIASRPYHDASLFYKLMEVMGQTIASGVDTQSGHEVSGDPRLMFGYLHLLAQLKREVKKRNDVWTGPHLENLLLNYVIPRVNSDFFFLRIKAILVLHFYARLPWSSEENFSNMICGLGGLLQDDDARVRLTTIDCLVEYLSVKRARPYLKNILVPLVNECMSMMDRVDTAFIPACLNYLAEHFGYELLPVLHDMNAKICKSCMATFFDINAAENLMANGETPDDSEMTKLEHKSLSVISTLKALYEMVVCCEHNPDVLRGMVPDLLAPVKAIFEQETLLPFMEHGCDILMHLLFILNPIPEALWELFPQLHHIVMNYGEGVDHFKNIANCIDNYISNGIGSFLTHPQYMPMTLEMCEKILLHAGSSVQEEELQQVPYVMSAMLHQAKEACPGGLLPRLPDLLGLMVRGLQSKVVLHSYPLQIRVLSVVCDCLWFNAEATCTILEKEGVIAPVFTKLISSFDRIEDFSQLRKKQYILGLSAFVALFSDTDAAQRACPSLCSNPQAASGAISSIVRFVAVCLRDNSKVYAKRTERLKESIERGYVEEDIDECEDGDMDLMVSEEIDDMGGEGDDDEEYDEDEYDQVADEDIDYISPLDKINEADNFVAAVTVAQNFANNATSGGLVLGVLEANAKWEDIQVAKQVGDLYMQACEAQNNLEKETVAKRSQTLTN